ncbi:MAG TPA: hypothetical protein PK629_04630 [Oscillospiraceae bacterium]|nr:hypothetical protein [Oscillospiraceae bacterium]HPF56528.1 hypothetical protein [Clostridiales bacterium]HPK34831.1 hypothetical protein [Oscillospiraceae bacterium]HPR76846.1 hypothetical protein [Oscillospiraceae bacterium]
MKKAKGLVFFVIALLILGLGYTAFAGVYTWYGARENTIIRGTKSLLTGIDLGKTAQIVLTPEEGSEVTADALEEARDLIEGRLSIAQYNSVSLNIDYTNNQIVLTIPLTEDYSVYQIQSLLEDIRGKGVLTFRNGDDVDENYLPTGDIILSNDGVSGAITGRTTDENQPAVQIYLNDDGTSALTSATYQMSGGTLSVWMDSTMLTAYTIDSAITNGKLVVTSDSMTMDSANELAYKINLGQMPFGFTYENIIEMSPTETNTLQNILLYTGCSFAVICILLIVFYRLTGVVISLGLILESTLSVILFTRYFPAFDLTTVTVPAIFTIILLGVITVALGVWQAERIKSGFNEKASFDMTVRGGLKGMSAATVDGVIVAGITAFFAMAAFGTSNYHLAWFTNFLSWMGVNPGGYTIYPLVSSLLYGLILTMLVVLLVQRVMINMLSGINAFKKPFLFGGKKDVL